MRQIPGHMRCTWRGQDFMPEQLTTHYRDMLVVGCSAGGVDALPRLVHPLPIDLPAAVFIVQHMAKSAAYLVDILQRSTTIPVSWAEQGERFRRGHVFVCPPDVHMQFADEHIRLSRGARENHARP